MSASEITAFEGLAFHQEAVRVRIWDDWGKICGVRTPSFHEFRPLLQHVLCDS
jgi:predicted HD phosphohydrolase